MMRWHFVKQPNGQYALFSEAVDNFVKYNLGRKEAIDVATNDYDCGRQTAEKKIISADNECIGYTTVGREPLARWEECLMIIETTHGKGTLRGTLDIITPTTINGTVKETR